MKNSKRIIAMLVALVLTIAMATTTTFAWFVVGNEVDVDAINVTVSADGGLFISDSADGVYKQYLALNESVAFDACTPVMNGLTAFASKPYTRYATATEWGALDPTTEQSKWELNPALDAYRDADEAYYYSTTATSGGQAFSATELTAVASYKYMQTVVSDSLVVPNNIDFTNDTAARYYYDEFFFKSTELKTVYLKSVTLSVPGGTPLTINTPEGLAADEFGTGSPAYAVDQAVTADVRDAIRVALFTSDGTLVGVYKFDQGTQDWADVANAQGYNLAEELYVQHTNGAPAILHGQTFTASTIGSGVSAGALTGSGTNWSGSCSVIVWLEGTDGHCINNLISQTVSIDFTFEGR